jgi:hypothetical protein
VVVAPYFFLLVPSFLDLKLVNSTPIVLRSESRSSPALGVEDLKPHLFVVEIIADEMGVEDLKPHLFVVEIIGASIVNPTPSSLGRSPVPRRRRGGLGVGDRKFLQLIIGASIVDPTPSSLGRSPFLASLGVEVPERNGGRGPRSENFFSGDVSGIDRHRPSPESRFLAALGLESETQNFLRAHR